MSMIDYPTLHLDIS